MQSLQTSKDIWSKMDLRKICAVPKHNELAEKRPCGQLYWDQTACRDRLFQYRVRADVRDHSESKHPRLPEEKRHLERRLHELTHVSRYLTSSFFLGGMIFQKSQFPFHLQSWLFRRLAWSDGSLSRLSHQP